MVDSSSRIIFQSFVGGNQGCLRMGLEAARNAVLRIGLGNGMLLIFFSFLVLIF